MGAAIGGGIAIFALALAWFSFKTWRVTPVVMVVLICCISFFFLYLTARVFKTHDVWRKIVIQQELEFEKLDAENKKLFEGAVEQGKATESGIRQIRQELYKLAVDRGGVYWGVPLEKIDAQSGAVTVAIENPVPHGLTPKMVVFAFDEDSVTQGGRFAGEFKVVAAPAMSKSVDLAPNLPMSQEELRLLSQSRGPWTLYLRMPVENPSIFAGMDDAARRALIPKVPPAEQDAFFDVQREKDGKLINYEVLLHELKLKAPLLTEQIRRQKVDIEKVVKEQQLADVEVKYREAEKAGLQTDLDMFKSEQDAVAKYSQALAAQLTEVKNQVRALFFGNKALAEELVELQKRAADAVNRRTGEAQASLTNPAVPVPEAIAN